MVESPQNHRKTIETNGLGAENHLMVMIEWAENIKWKWLAQKTYLQLFSMVPKNHSRKLTLESGYLFLAFCCNSE